MALPRVGVDSHAHVDLEDFNADREEILDRALACGVARTGNVFLGPQAYAANKGLFARRPEVFFLLGIHPGNADTYNDDAAQAMRQAFLADPRLRALGEIGLDYYWDDHPRELQAQVFRAQLALARELDLPPVIHCREAFDDALRILLEEGFSGRRLLWHCFGGDAAQAETLLAQGWHLSIPGPVSYARNEGLRAAAAMIPLERMTLETDSPYLAAEPWRGKRNHPALVGFTAGAVAALKNLPPEDVWAATGRTATKFFALEDLP